MRISDWSSDVCSSDLDNGVFRNDPGRITPADIDIMTAPIGSVDNQIVAVIRLIGQAALDDTSDDRRHLCRFGDGIVGRRALKAMLGKGALHGPDDVAARSEEHTSELQSLMRNSYAVFCLHKKTEQDQGK